jgi:hypothetical protein
LTLLPQPAKPHDLLSSLSTKPSLHAKPSAAVELEPSVLRAKGAEHRDENRRHPEHSMLEIRQLQLPAPPPNKVRHPMLLESLPSTHQVTGPVPSSMDGQVLQLGTQVWAAALSSHATDP